MTPSIPLPQHSVTTPDWRHALGGVWRLTFPRYLAPKNLLITTGLLAGLALLALTSMRAGHMSAKGFVDWSMEVYLGFAVPVAAFLIGAGLIRDDMTAATVDYVLTRPIRRPLFVMFRYLTNLVCLEVACLAGLAGLTAIGVYRGVPGIGAITGLALLTQLLSVAAFSAMGFAFGAFTGRYLVLGIFYALLIEAGLGRIPTQLSRLSMKHHLQTIMTNAPTGGAQAANDGIVLAVSSLLVFTSVMAAIATCFFTMRELAGSRAKEA